MTVQTARGTRDLLPSQMHARLHVIAIIREVFAEFGFEPLETPAIERLETLVGKYGEEGEKLTFRILERGEGGREGKADLALRYDLTVPLARVMAMNQALPLPFKRYQVQPVWRAERPQKGRFREFYQCDADIVGAPGRRADAECITVAHTALCRLGFDDFEILVNDRRILRAIARELANTDRENDVLVAIDKLDKIGWDGVAVDLGARGIATTWLTTFRTMLDGPDPLAEFLSIAPEAGRELGEVMAAARTQGVTHMRFDATLARGLGYYTGTVYEARILGGGVGSVSGGGRYDDLIGMFSGRSVPAVGVSLGLERLLVVMEERGMLPVPTTRTLALVTVFSAELTNKSLEIAARLRSDLRGRPRGGVETWLGEAGALGKQFKYAANKQIPWAIVIGPDEAAEGLVSVKNLLTGQQTKLPEGELVQHLSE